jgi:ParB family chromosome partitioning protein
VPLSSIDVGGTFRRDKTFASLADSIRVHGVLQPIRIRPGEGDHYEIIAGRRRYFAAKKLGLRTIPAVVGMPTDDEMAVQSIENLSRRDLAPLEEAEAFRALLAQGHLTQVALGAQIGRRQSYISNSMRLLNQPETVRAALTSGAITVAHAKAIAALPAERQQDLVQRIIEEKLTTRAVEQEVANTRGGKRRQTVNKDELARLAVQVALDAPLRQGPSGRSARIPWTLISQIRREADRQGIDWRKYHRQTVEK